MRARHWSGALFAAVLILCSASPQAQEPAGGKPARLLLEIDTPEPGAVVGDPGGNAFIAGRALALFGKLQTFDIMFVIDTSDSTAAPSGADVDGDGRLGSRRGGQWLSIFGKTLPLGNTDRGDSILAAEISAVETLLDQLDPRTTRVGVVTFSGDFDPGYPDAFTRVPLTSDFTKVRRGLREVLDDGPNGMTNMRSGVHVGTIELLGTASAYSERREGVRRIMLFLTDGRPTLPHEGRPAWNTRAAIGGAKRAARASIRIDTYAIGEEALREPIVAVEMARVTNGVFTPVRHPENLRAIFESVSFAEIAELRIQNLTTNRSAVHAIRNADGTFSSLVPMQEGKNLVEIYARSTDGTEARKQLELQFVPGRSVQRLAPRLVAQRNRLLENQLLQLQRRRLKIQAERDEDLRRELQVEIEKERAAAELRAEKARRRLKIELE